jgi:hypothetical protein
MENFVISDLGAVTNTEYLHVCTNYVYTKFPISRYKKQILNIMTVQEYDVTIWLLRHGLLGLAIINLHLLYGDILFKSSQVTDRKY